MSQKSSGPLSKFNLALALLWLVDVVVTVAGYLILTSSNATQADFYTSQSADYVAYFSAQSGSNLGATLIGAGVIGVIITLAAHVVARSIKKAAAVAAGLPTDAVDAEPDFDFDDTEFDTADQAAFAATPAAESTGTTKTAVVDAAAEPTPAAASADEAPADAAFSDAEAEAPYGSTTTR
ncbi:hypothetical protein [Cryobacterium sp. AP23]